MVDQVGTQIIHHAKDLLDEWKAIDEAAREYRNKFWNFAWTDDAVEWPELPLTKESQQQIQELAREGEDAWNAYMDCMIAMHDGPQA